MDTHFLEIYKYYKSEFDLYEGLITSYPLHEVIGILERKGYNVKGNYKNNTFSLKFEFSEDKNKAYSEFEEIMRITNNCGYFCSNMKGENKENEFKIFKYSLEKFKDLIDIEFNLINFSFEAKYDIIIERIPEVLYHLTPTRNVPKILKNGLVPKSRSKKAYHPDRIYLAKKIEDLSPLSIDFYEGTNIREWTILKINTEIISDYFKIYKDPNFEDKGYYTLNTIHPIAIKIYQNIEL
jgi:hypothetical protein